jgi:hypothetical protein
MRRSVEISTEKISFNILIGLMLTTCIGMAVATYIGFKKLNEKRGSTFLFKKQAQTLLDDRAANTNAPPIGFVIPDRMVDQPHSLRTYSSDHINYVNAM